MESSIAEFLQRRAVCNPGLPLGGNSMIDLHIVWEWVYDAVG
jgi:hypothetical protein